MKKTQKKGTKKIKKGAVAFLMLFVAWTVLSGMFLYKVAGPTLDLIVVKDNYNYSQEYGNPQNWDSKNESYSNYNDYVNSLINSDDGIVSFYAQQSGALKMAMLIGAFVPFFLIFKFFVETHEEEKRAKKKRALKKRTNKIIKAARA